MMLFFGQVFSWGLLEIPTLMLNDFLIAKVLPGAERFCLDAVGPISVPPDDGSSQTTKSATSASSTSSSPTTTDHNVNDESSGNSAVEPDATSAGENNHVDTLDSLVFLGAAGFVAFAL